MKSHSDTFDGVKKSELANYSASMLSVPPLGFPLMDTSAHLSSKSGEMKQSTPHKRQPYQKASEFPFGNMFTPAEKSSSKKSFKNSPNKLPEANGLKLERNENLDALNMMNFNNPALAAYYQPLASNAFNLRANAAMSSNPVMAANSLYSAYLAANRSNPYLPYLQALAQNPQFGNMASLAHNFSPSLMQSAKAPNDFFMNAAAAAFGAANQQEILDNMKSKSQNFESTRVDGDRLKKKNKIAKKSEADSEPKLKTKTPIAENMKETKSEEIDAKKNDSKRSGQSSLESCEEPLDLSVKISSGKHAVKRKADVSGDLAGNAPKMAKNEEAKTPSFTVDKILSGSMSSSKASDANKYLNGLLANIHNGFDLAQLKNDQRSSPIFNYHSKNSHSSNNTTPSQTPPHSPFSAASSQSFDSSASKGRTHFASESVKAASNSVPTCTYCNRTFKDDLEMDEHNYRREETGLCSDYEHENGSENDFGANNEEKLENAVKLMERDENFLSDADNHNYDDENENNYENEENFDCSEDSFAEDAKEKDEHLNEENAECENEKKVELQCQPQSSASSSSTPSPNYSNNSNYHAMHHHSIHHSNGLLQGLKCIQ
jgi:hypothetical protein